MYRIKLAGVALAGIFTAATGFNFVGPGSSNSAKASKIHNQSPINIKPHQCERASSKAPFKIIGHEHLDIPVRVVDKGDTYQVDCPDAGYIEIEQDGEEKSFSLMQFHEHSPSEHQINNQHTAMEFHFVHKSKDGEILVAALFVQEGKYNPEAQKLVESLRNNTVSQSRLSLSSWLENIDHSFEYLGSLTTPGYGKAKWVICKTPVEMSAEQIEILGGGHKGNNRSVQPLTVPVFSLD